MEEYKQKFYDVLENIGIYLEKPNEDLIIQDIITDSLTYITFFLEIEREFNITIPDEDYSDKTYSYKVSEFIEKIIIPQLNVELHMMN